MKDVKALCLDIDGTLLDDKKTIPDYVRTTLKRAHEKGIRIILASARMPAGVELIERQLGLPCEKMCNAGAYLLVKGECVFSKHFSPETLEHIYKTYVEPNDLGIWIFQDKQWYVNKIDSFISREIEIVQYIPMDINVSALVEKWKKEGTGPSKLLIAAEPEKIREFQADIIRENYPDIDVARSSEFFLEAFPKGVSKKSAMEIIAESLGISVKQVAAFGDQQMDIPMVEAAGFGIAMGNAVNELKDCADYITITNNEGGVAYAIEHYLGI